MKDFNKMMELAIYLTYFLHKPYLQYNSHQQNLNILTYTNFYNIPVLNDYQNLIKTLKRNSKIKCEVPFCSI